MVLGGKAIEASPAANDAAGVSGLGPNDIFEAGKCGVQAEQPAKKVNFELVLPEAPQQLHGKPMRLSILPHDSAESILVTVKNFYALLQGVSLEDEKGNILIAQYENFTADMTVYVHAIKIPADAPSSAPLPDQIMDEDVNTNSSCLVSDKPSHGTFAVSGDSQPSWEPFASIEGVCPLPACLNMDTTVHNSTLPGADDIKASSASSIFPMQCPEGDDYPEEVAAGDAEERRSSKQDSTNRVEARSKQKASPIETSVGERVWKACDRCRLRKFECDGAGPCKRCCADSAACTYGDENKSHAMATISEHYEDTSMQGNTTSVAQVFPPDPHWGKSSSSLRLGSPFIPKPRKRRPTFKLGGSSEGSSTGTRNILPGASQKPGREAHLGAVVKDESFKNTRDGAIIHRSTSGRVLEIGSNENVSDDAIEEDDDDAIDLENKGKASGPSSVNEFELCKRVDSRPHPTSCHALLRTITSKPDSANMTWKASEPVVTPRGPGSRTMRRSTLNSEPEESPRESPLRGPDQNTGRWSRKRRSSSPDFKGQRHRHDDLDQRHGLGAVAKSRIPKHIYYAELWKSRSVPLEESPSPPAERQKSAASLASGSSSRARSANDMENKHLTKH
ncbi:MAG: hypothetical protein Q9165_004390 [Trypethelium subeluteriae]